MKEAKGLDFSTRPIRSQTVFTGISLDSPGVQSLRRPCQPAGGGARVCLRWCSKCSATSRLSSSALPVPAALRYQHARSDAQWHQRGLLRALSQQSGGRAGGGIHGPAEKKCQLWDSECRPHHLCRDWGHVAILHRGLPGAQSWPCSSVGDESSVHRFCIYVAHLGQVHALIDLPASICHLKKKKEKNQPTYLGPKV